MMHTNYEMRMPVKYAELSDEEMEYDGGVWNFVAAVGCSVLSFACSIAAEVTGNKYLEYASYALAGASIALSFGATSMVSLAGKGVLKKSTAKAITKIFNPTNSASYGAYGNAATAISAPTDLAGYAFMVNKFF